MNAWITAFDLILATGLFLSARKALFARDLFQAIAFYIAYGLLMALTWIRLNAPDIALAEAAVGTGMTTALLLDAVRKLKKSFSPTALSLSAEMRLVLLFCSCLLTIATLAALIELRPPLQGLYPKMLPHMPQSGVSYPMTAVLLNFRAWDTWLELGVLFIASLAVLNIHRTHHFDSFPKIEMPLNQTLRWITRIMVPLLITIGGYVLWAGSRDPGGAFQAGALIGGAGVLMQLGEINLLENIDRKLLKLALALGFCVFSVIAIAVVPTGRKLLEYPADWAGSLILLIEIAATISIALTLNVMYAGSHAPEHGATRDE